jgi:hypothetical protein
VKSRKSLAASRVIDRTLLKRLTFSQIASRTRVSSQLQVSFLYSHYCGLGAIADRHLDWHKGCPRAICSPPSASAVSPTSAIYSESNFL